VALEKQNLFGSMAFSQFLTANSVKSVVKKLFYLWRKYIYSVHNHIYIPNT
jgi:hypothetical protein